MIIAIITAIALWAFNTFMVGNPWTDFSIPIIVGLCVSIWIRQNDFLCEWEEKNGNNSTDKSDRK